MTTQMTSKIIQKETMYGTAEVGEARRKSQGRFLAHLIRFLRQRPRRAVIIFVVLVSIGAGLYIGVFRLVRGFLPWSSPEVRAAVEIARAVRAVSRHMLLPEETPVLAAVTDAAALKTQQPFFENAQNGDQLLMFPTSLQAIIYSPSRDIIVKVGPIEYSNDETAPPLAPSNTSKAENAVVPEGQTVTVEVRNGTNIIGRASQIARTIRDDTSYSVLSVTDANTNTYAKTLVVDISNKSTVQEAVATLASRLGARIVTDLPQGERASNADVVVILGANP